MVTVSVVIPTYNREDTIYRCLKSVSDQTFEDIEIIVVDDFSTDSTPELVEQYDDKRLNFIQHKRNRGANAARNSGIDASNGDYIAFIDSDDEWHPEKIKKQLNVFKKGSSDIGIVYTSLYFRESKKKRSLRIPKSKGDIYKKQLMSDQVGPTSSVMVKPECFEKVGKFDTQLPARQDYEMWLRITEFFEVDYVDEALTILHTDSDDRISSNYEERINAEEKILDEVKSRYSDFNYLERRKIISKHYESRAVFAHTSNHGPDALRYSGKSLKLYPLSLTSLAIVVLVLLSISPQNKNLLFLKNKIRVLRKNIRNIWQQFK